MLCNVSCEMWWLRQQPHGLVRMYVLFFLISAYCEVKLTSGKS